MKYPIIDWASAPKWAKWHAIDSDGNAWFYQKKPIKMEYHWINEEAFSHQQGIDQYDQCYIIYGINWKTAITRRPGVFSFLYKIIDRFKKK